MEITVTFTGVRPMLQHNVRLANPLDPYTQKIKSITDKRKKSEEDLAEILWWEARGGAYETHEGFIGLPVDNAWRCIYDAATASRRGADMKRALIPLGDVEPLLIAGEKVYVDDHLNAGHIMTKAVSVRGNRTMRHRLIADNWSASHQFELLTDLVDMRDLQPIVEHAGRVVGLGDYRPRYGTFTAVVEESK